jgi:hypothetical protein
MLLPSHFVQVVLDRGVRVVGRLAGRVHLAQICLSRVIAIVVNSGRCWHSWMISATVRVIS